MIKGQRPSRHLRRVWTKKGRKIRVVNPKIKRRVRKTRIRLTWQKGKRPIFSKVPMKPFSVSTIAHSPEMLSDRIREQEEITARATEERTEQLEKEADEAEQRLQEQKKNYEKEYATKSKEYQEVKSNIEENRALYNNLHKRGNSLNNTLAKIKDKTPEEIAKLYTEKDPSKRLNLDPDQAEKDIKDKIKAYKETLPAENKHQADTLGNQLLEKVKQMKEKLNDAMAIAGLKRPPAPSAVKEKIKEMQKKDVKDLPFVEKAFVVGGKDVPKEYVQPSITDEELKKAETVAINKFLDELKEQTSKLKPTDIKPGLAKILDLSREDVEKLVSGNAQIDKEKGEVKIGNQILSLGLFNKFANDIDARRKAEAFKIHYNKLDESGKKSVEKMTRQINKQIKKEKTLVEEGKQREYVKLTKKERELQKKRILEKAAKAVKENIDQDASAINQARKRTEKANAKATQLLKKINATNERANDIIEKKQGL